MKRSKMYVYSCSFIILIIKTTINTYFLFFYRLHLFRENHLEQKPAYNLNEILQFENVRAVIYLHSQLKANGWSEENCVAKSRENEKQSSLVVKWLKYSVGVGIVQFEWRSLTAQWAQSCPRAPRPDGFCHKNGSR